MMAALCGQKYKDGRVVTDREVAHMLTALLMAGQHTSSSSVSWTVMHLANSPTAAYVFSSRFITPCLPIFQSSSVRGTGKTLLKP